MDGANQPIPATDRVCAWNYHGAKNGGAMAGHSVHCGDAVGGAFLLFQAPYEIFGTINKKKAWGLLFLGLDKQVGPMLAGDLPSKIF